MSGAVDGVVIHGRGAIRGGVAVASCMVGLQESEGICGRVVNWQRRFVGIFASCRQMPTVEFGGCAERGLEEGSRLQIISGAQFSGVRIRHVLWLCVLKFVVCCFSGRD